MDDLEKLQAQIADLQRKAEDLLNQKKAAVIEDVRAKIKAYGLTDKEVGFSHKGKVGTPVLIKYRHPTEPMLTWTGRGKKPRWLEAYIAQGGKLEDVMI